MNIDLPKYKRWHYEPSQEKLDYIWILLWQTLNCRVYQESRYKTNQIDDKNDFHNLDGFDGLLALYSSNTLDNFL